MTVDEAMYTYIGIGSEDSQEELEEIKAQILDTINEALWDNEERVIIININN